MKQDEIVERIDRKIKEILDSVMADDPDALKKATMVKVLMAERNKAIEAGNNAEHNAEMEAVEWEKLEAEKEATKQGKRLKIAEIASAVGMTVVGGLIGLWKFARATEKENPGFPETIDTLTDRTVVQDGLKERPFRLPWNK